tara:strand:+ start:526 stop:711 length:186 start_codon:yes stop_codon:yes gene_type:complete
MTAHLLLCVLIVVASSARTARVAAVLPIITDIALAEAILAGAMVTTVVDTMEQVKVPERAG